MRDRTLPCRPPPPPFAQSGGGRDCRPRAVLPLHRYSRAEAAKEQRGHLGGTEGQQVFPSCPPPPRPLTPDSAVQANRVATGVLEKILDKQHNTFHFGPTDYADRPFHPPPPQQAPTVPKKSCCAAACCGMLQNPHQQAPKNRCCGMLQNPHQQAPKNRCCGMLQDPPPTGPQKQVLRHASTVGTCPAAATLLAPAGTTTVTSDGDRHEAHLTQPGSWPGCTPSYPPPPCLSSSLSKLQQA